LQQAASTNITAYRKKSREQKDIT